MKKITLFAMLMLGISLTGCVPSPRQQSSNKTAQIAQEKSAKEAQAQLGMPSITNFQEKKLAKLILEARDIEDLLCYAYLANMHGTLIYLGQCIGYGLPYSTQYTNPEVVGGYNSSPYTLPQADPNQLFMPDGMSATWLMMIDPETGKPRPVYLEPEIIVSPFKLHK